MRFHFCFSLAGIPTGIINYTIELKISVITAEIKKYKSLIRKEKKDHDKIVPLAKSKLKSVEVLISKALIDDFFLTNDALIEFYDMKEEI